jgi:hypothetical protein
LQLAEANCNGAMQKSEQILFGNNGNRANKESDE